MRFLRILGLVLVHARAVGHISRAEAILDRIAGGHHGFGRHVDAIGPHIGDMPRLIQTLRRRHAGLGAHAELAAGLLLQGGGHEGRIGVARRGLGFHRGDLEIARCHRLHGQFGGFGGGDIELIQLLAAQNGQLGFKFLPARGHEDGGHAPVFAGAEGLDLHLAFDDQAQTDRLHPACRFGARQLAPQHRRQGEAHQIIQRTAGQIGLHQRGIDLTGVLHRLGHRRFGDGVEGDTADLLALLQAGGQRLLQVPADRLALAIRVSRQDQFIIGLQGLGNGADMLLAFGRHLPFHLEIMFGIHRTIFRRQVADMAVRGQNRIAGTKIFVDCLGLGRGFDDDDCHMYLLRQPERRRGKMGLTAHPCQGVPLASSLGRSRGWPDTGRIVASRAGLAGQTALPCRLFQDRDNSPPGWRISFPSSSSDSRWGATSAAGTARSRIS